MISLCYQNNISFDINNLVKNEILGGSLTIQSIIGLAFKQPAIRSQLRQRSIMFLDQLTTPDGWMLHNWNFICSKLFNNGLRAAALPKWFKILSTLVINNNDGRRLISPSYHTPPSSHLKATSLLQINQAQIHTPFISIWNNTLRGPIVGRVVYYQPLNQVIIVEHWVINPL